MRRLSRVPCHIASSLAACFVLSTALLAQTEPTPVDAPAAAPPIPIFFVEAADGGLAGASFVGRSGGLQTAFHRDHIALGLQSECSRAAVSLRFEGAACTPLGEQHLPGKLNVLVGEESSWRRGLDLYGAIAYRELWPGIDLVMHGNGGELEYDLHVAPGADLGLVALRIEGADAVALGADGAMVIGTTAGELRQKPPRTWEVAADGSRVIVPAAFELRTDGSFGFRVARQDESRPLVVDPVLVWSTFFGQNGTSDTCESLAVDESGNVYIAGMTWGMDNYTTRMVIEGPPYPIGATDGYVAKLDPSQTGPAQLLWLTVIGGNGYNSHDSLQALALRPSGNVVLAGRRHANEIGYPVVASDNSDPLGMNWLGELSPDGASLIHGFQFGARPMGEVLFELLPDGRLLWGSDSAFAGCPTTPGAFQPAWNLVANDLYSGNLWFGIFDLSLPPASRLVWASYFGGYNPALEGLALSPTEPGVFTFSSKILSPVDSPYTHASGSWGHEDSLIGRFDTTQSGAAQLRFAHLLGDAYSVSNVVADPDGTTWAVVYRPTALSQYLLESAVLRLAADGASLMEGWGFASGLFRRADLYRSADGTLTVIGENSSIPVTTDATQAVAAGGSDVAVVQLDIATRQVTYGTYWGGETFDTFSAGCSHLNGNVLTIVGTTRSRTIPLANAYKTEHLDSYSQGLDVFLVRMTLPGDTDPPVVTITAPGDGTITGATAIAVSADITDDSATTLTSTPAGLTPDTFVTGGGSASGVLPLDAEGVNTISVEATDAYGNPSAMSVIVYRDTVAPDVAVSPAEDTIVSMPLPSFAIMVTDQTSTSVSIGGSPAGVAPVDGDGAYGVASIALAGTIGLWQEGPNSIVVEAIDAAGNATTVTRTVILDSTAPVVEIVMPVNGACYPSGSPPEIPLLVNVSDATVTEVTGALAGALPAGGGNLVGTFALQEGVNVISVTATNPGTGLFASDTISVTRDTIAPTVAITSPEAGAIVRGSVEFHATVSDVLPGTIASATYFVHGVALPPSGLYVVDTTALADGPYELRVDATDACGNPASASITIWVDNTAPEVLITNPIDLSTVSGTIPFDAWVTDGNSGLVAVTMLAANAAPTVDGSQTYATPQGSAGVTSFVNTLYALGGLDGDLELEVTAVDAAGNSTSFSVTVHVENAVSEALITSPADGALVRCVVDVVASVSMPALASVQFVIDGVGLPPLTAPPYEVAYDTRDRLDGELPIVLRATDLYGNVISSSIDVVVDNLEVKIEPETLQLKSKGGDKSVTVKIRGQSANLLWCTDPQQITLCVPGGSPIPATLVFGQHTGWRCNHGHEVGHRGSRHGHEHGCHGNERGVLVKFNRQLLIGALRGAGITHGKVEMTVKVTVNGETFVIGSDTVRVKSH